MRVGRDGGVHRGAELRRRIEHDREQGDARVHLHGEPDHEQRKTEIANAPRNEPALAKRPHAVLRGGRARERRRPRVPPSAAPAVLAIKSMTFASRGGTNICSVSIVNDIAAPAAIATESRPAGGRRRGTSATKKPNGA